MSEESLTAYNELLDALSQLRRLRPTSELMPDGVTPSEMSTLVMIGHAERAGHDIRPGFIAAHTHTSKGAVSQNLKSLEEKGLIVRERSAADARAVRILLTDQGKQSCLEAHQMRNAQMQALVEYLGAEDLDHLTRIVRRVVNYQEEHGAYVADSDCCSDHGPIPGASKAQGGMPCA